MPTDQVIFITLLAYLAGFGVLIIGRKNLSIQLGNVLSISINTLGLLLSFWLISRFRETEIFQYKWVKLGQHEFNFTLLINKLSLLMLALVQGIALLVQVFSLKYMKGDPRYLNYFSYLNLFVFSMLGLVVSGNLLFIFFFWELVGFCSYLLIGFWFEKQSATNASLKAFIVNRIGDAGFLIGIGLVFFLFNTLDLELLSNSQSTAAPGVLTLTALMLFMGCVGKSAQFPLQIWLPDAMEGPTPVSALIHAATMVAAGIFLLARIDFLITPDAGLIIALIGAVTALLAAYSAIFQFDIKKVLAYSTVSQLGLMVMGMGVGAANASLFHLFTHAFFKAGLFLIAGAIIHYAHHEQDMRKMGGLLYKKPWLAFSYIICGAALAGLPFTSGFLSKDALILSAFNWSAEQANPMTILIPLMGIIASVMTAFYVTRQFVLIFLSSSKEKIKWSKPDLMEWVIFPLVICSFWLLHSNNPLDFVTSNFSTHFEIKHQENHWVAYSLLAAAILSIGYSYYRFQILKKDLPQNIWSNLGLNHYYLDHFYVKRVACALVGKFQPNPLDNVNTEEHISSGLTDLVQTIDQKAVDGLVNKIGTGQKNFAKGLTQFDRKGVDGFVGLLTSTIIFLGNVGSYIDSKLVDGLIGWISRLVSNIGEGLRKVQSGRLQSYLMVLILIFVALLIFLAIF
ncbi:MAG: NADH-quinone oxidoreductase subunit L [Cytophagales bacterium]|nr:NADH-quinone oxidoreductase subunit L [Cytophagales bacterium]